MDFVKRHRRKQVAIWLLLIITAALANLPKEWAERFNLQTEYLLGVLGLLMVLALFFFARFSYLVTTILLIVGANLPDRWAQGLSIDKTPLIVALIITVVGSLLNQVSRILPSGLEPKPREKNPEGIRALVAAIPRGQLRAVKTVIGMNIELNAFDDQGLSPLMVAAKSGQAEIIGMLLGAGADVGLRNPAGLTATEIAVEAGHAEAASILREASLKADQARREAPPATPPVEAPSRL